MANLTDEQCDEILREMAKRGEYATRECIRDLFAMIESGELDKYGEDPNQ